MSEWISIDDQPVPEGRFIKVLVIDKIRSGRLSRVDLIRHKEKYMVPGLNEEKTGIRTWIIDLDYPVRYWLKESLPEQPAEMWISGKKVNL